MKCTSCNKEFEPKRKNQKYCEPNCPKLQKMFFGGGIKRKGRTTTVTGVLNCMMYMRDMK
jgi:hypothetical protein